MEWKDFLKDLGFKEGLIAGSMLTAVALIGSWLWAERVDVGLLDAMAAFGTVGAAIAAVWLGLREGGWRESERRSRARLIASSVKFRLSNCVRDLEKAIDVLRPREDHFMLLKDATDIVQSSFERASRAISVDEIHLIQPLIGRAADILAENIAKCGGIASVALVIKNASSDEIISMGADSPLLLRTAELVRHCESVEHEIKFALNEIRQELNSAPPA